MKIAVAVMAAVFALYVWLLGGRSIALLATGFERGEPVAAVMGGAMIVFPLLGGWALLRELWFGYRAEQLSKRLGEEGLLPNEQVALTPSGRVVRGEADALFPAYREAAQASPDDWRNWFRLSILYDAAGDRRRARETARKAMRLERSA
ncbi:hypothetical protein ACFOEP_03365 [Microbacterium amylolyticum]